MKRLFLILLSVPAFTANAQIFSGEAGQGTLLGGLVGGIIGHNSDRRTMEGIGIGAGTGWLLGTLTREQRQRGSYDTYIPSRRRSLHADSAPASHRPHHAVTGAALGAVAGGIIGHNQNRQTLEGIGIGAVTGLAVGGIAEHVSRRHESRHYYALEAQPKLVSNSRFYRNPTPPAEREAIKQSDSRLDQKAYVFERISSSRTSNRRQASPTTTASSPIQAQTVIIHHYYHLPVATNSPSAKAKGAGR